MGTFVAAFRKNLSAGSTKYLLIEVWFVYEKFEAQLHATTIEKGSQKQIKLI